jgi:2,4-dienoyl-CoA reductase (NADPH2)
MVGGVSYRKVDDAGLHITVGDKDMTCRPTPLCCVPGRTPSASLQAELQAAGCTVHLIGGADKAAELDAKRAIKQGTELALSLGPSRLTPAGRPSLPLWRCSRLPLQRPKACTNGMPWWPPATLANSVSILHPKAGFPLADGAHALPQRAGGAAYPGHGGQRCLRTSPTTAKWPATTD